MQNFNRALSVSFSVLYLVGGWAHSQSIVVDTTGSTVDFGGLQEVGDLPGPNGSVSFLEAIRAANNTSGPQSIVFQIPTSDPGFTTFGAFSVSVGSGFALTDDGTTIDGTTQTAFTGNTALGGPEVLFTSSMFNAFFFDAVSIESDDNELRGVAIYSWWRTCVVIPGSRNTVAACVLGGSTRDGMRITGADNVIGGNLVADRNFIRGNSQTGVLIESLGATGNVVIGNVVGKDEVSNLITGNLDFGIVLQDEASFNRIGGFSPGERNVISGNSRATGQNQAQGAEVVLGGHHNSVLGNYIGLDLTGTIDLAGAARAGVLISGNDNTLGGSEATAGNVVSGFTWPTGGPTAVRVAEGDGHRIFGNLIGTDAGGTLAIPSRMGIDIASGVSTTVTDLKIGGRSLGEANTIAFNERDGVSVGSIASQANRVLISGNSIHSNGELAIDLAAEFLAFPFSITPNDPGDLDAGPNGLLNHPVLTAAIDFGSSVSVFGTMDTTAPSSIEVELFANVSEGQGGRGDAQQFLVATTPDASGAFQITIPGPFVGAFLSATAIDQSGNTSEVSPAIPMGGSAAEIAAFCFADGGDAMGCGLCPCGNDAALGTIGGCLNGVGGSARLVAGGSPSVSTDTLRLQILAANPSTFAILISGPTQLPTNPSNPCPAGSGIVGSVLDGLRCVGGGTLRHGTRATDLNGLGNGPWGSGLLLQSSATVGETRNFQAFYREDPAVGCATGQNTTNAIELLVAP